MRLAQGILFSLLGLLSGCGLQGHVVESTPSTHLYSYSQSELQNLAHHFGAGEDDVLLASTNGEGTIIYLRDRTSDEIYQFRKGDAAPKIVHEHPPLFPVFDRK